MGEPVDRYLPLLHAFEQAGLCPGCCPVNFVGQKNMGKQRTRPEFKIARFLIIKINPAQIGRQQVRRKLDPLEGSVQRTGERLRQ
ncbi:hypothetical protein D3C76_1265250 [compost metagenome]